MNGLEFATAAVASITLIGVAVGRYPRLKLNRASIAFVGAVALIALGSLSLEEAFAAVDGHTVALLFGMMVLNVNLRAAGFFDLLTARIMRQAHSPRVLLALIIAASGVCSAVFLNDTVVLVFTPLVLDLSLALRRNPLPYLIGLVTAANIGSVATITGNPQNMLIGLSSGIGYVEFTQALAPLAIAGLVVAWAVITVVYRQEFRAASFEPPGELAPAVIDPPHLRKCLAASGLMIAMLLLGAPIALAALVAAALLLLTHADSKHVFAQIDWSLLVFFCALFVVTGAIEASDAGNWLLAALAPFADEPAGLTGTAVVLSNVVSNVPAVMLFRPVIPALDSPHTAWLTLAMATTFAGNLTLLGSVANLIVAEIARERGVHLTFSAYLKAGAPIAVITLLLGIFWLS